jgi:hypothetical protein
LLNLDLCRLDLVDQTDQNELREVQPREADLSELPFVCLILGTDRKSFLERKKLNFKSILMWAHNLPPVPIGSKCNGSKSDRPIPTAGCGGLIGPPRNGS